MNLQENLLQIDIVVAFLAILTAVHTHQLLPPCSSGYTQISKILSVDDFTG